ncbi:MAG: M20/M25/M40 family metallo-hydrolase [Microbacteriaceae bacterium]|jgi:acetylornithine deacetylase/succinyl-diaminopimelate desuccinylase-like protein|nr:M20/M25/M40 family metallo-hydrolase [Microbacteriaceae bacterium]MCI1206848.1 M20/M25/M40 family metallo-hydrolase [Microbacteriaceae bacterium]
MATTAHPHLAQTETEAVEIAQQLIRIDTSNDGSDQVPGERPAAEYAAALLEEVGIHATLYDSAPGRTNLVARVEGTDPALGALLLHGHLDVVPAEADDWSVPPFAAEIRDDPDSGPVLWGRGALDMKGTDAVFLSAVRALARSGRRPHRTLVLALFADEEASGYRGAKWMAPTHPEAFAGVTDAITEGGGASIRIGAHTAYTLQTAEKSYAWLRLRVRGDAGHGSLQNPRNAVTLLTRALARVGDHVWPLHLTPTVLALLEGLSALSGLPLDLRDAASLEALAHAAGPIAPNVLASLRTVANPTGLTAGYKPNVIPSEAQGTLDLRIPPGFEREDEATLRELLGPEVRIETIAQADGIASPVAGPTVDSLRAALQTQDPQATLLPFTMSGGTDNKALSQLGIRGYGFSPELFPEGFRPAGLVHGVDERIPLSTLRFGARVIEQLLAAL